MLLAKLAAIDWEIYNGKKNERTTEVAQLFRVEFPSTTDPVALPAAAIPKRLTYSAVFLLKLSDAPRGIDNFLLTCIKRVTVRTDLYMEILSKSRTRFKTIATVTSHLDRFVLWMNLSFHSSAYLHQLNK